MKEIKTRIRDVVIDKGNKFKYLGAYVTNKNEVTEEMKSRLVSGNAFFYSVKKLLTSRLISRKLKLKIYKTVILSIILYGCESWSTTLADEHTLRVFENKVLRKIYGPKREEMTGEWRRLHNEVLHGLYDSPEVVKTTEIKTSKVGRPCGQGRKYEKRSSRSRRS